ncbi:MAG: response regulator [Bacteroidales bacterium]|nr:response regulator [Bacteroidales bacterium]
MKTILIIEDDTMLLQTTSDFLEKEGYKALQAEDGLTGIKKAMDEIPDLILCDIAVPQLDGYQIYNTLQQNPSTEPLPFIFLTAKTEKEDIRAGMNLGADDYITKPFDFDELLTAIQTRLAKYQKLLDKTHENFHGLLNNSMIGIFISQNDRIVFSNPKFAEICGYQKQELDHIFLQDLIHPEDKEDFYSALRKCERGVQKRFHQKFRLLKKNNQYIEVESSGGITTLNNEKAVLGMVGLSDPGFDYSGELYPLEDLNKTINGIIQNKETIPDEMAQKLASEFDKETKEQEFKNEEGLTKREIEVLQYICRGMTNQEIADHMYVSVKTVDSHRTSLLEKTGSKNTADLVIYAVKNNAIELD